MQSSTANVFFQLWNGGREALFKRSSKYVGSADTESAKIVITTSLQN